MRGAMAAMGGAAAAFDPASIPQMEAAANASAVGGVDAYDLDSNLALLRLYAMYPDKLNIPVAANVLVKALMALPGPDFKLCQGMLPARVMRQEPFATLAQLSGCLETADFAGFWAKAGGVAELTSGVTGFEDAVRRYGAHCIGATFRDTDTAAVAAVLNLTEGEVKGFLSASFPGWEVAADGTIKVPASQSNAAPAAGDSVRVTLPSETIARLISTQ